MGANHLFRGAGSAGAGPGDGGNWDVAAVEVVGVHREKKGGHSQSWLFHRIARSYGFVPMPPMPPNPSRVEERAQAVRRALSLVQGGAIIGLAPEGREGSDSSLIVPPVGAGRFLLLLAKAGLLILPVGVAEKNGTLTASFGEPFTLKSQPGLEKSRQDRRVCETVMVAIGKLLPPELWGVYREQIDAEDPLLGKGEDLWPD